jgi:hypothetical protein
MSQPNDIDERPFGGVQAHRAAITDSKFFTAKIERVSSKHVNVSWRAQRRNTATAWNGNVDAGGNNVGQPVTGQRCDQAKRATGRSMRNFQKILVSFRSARPLIQASADLPDNP